MTLYYTFFMAALCDWDFKKKRIKVLGGFTYFMFSLLVTALSIGCMFLVVRLYIKVYWYNNLDPVAFCINLIYLFGITFFCLVFIDLLFGGADSMVEISRQTIKLDKQLKRTDKQHVLT
jgi:hypothetical protein